MDQPSILDQVKAFVGLGGGATASFFILRWVERAVRWMSERHDKRQVQLDNQAAALDRGWQGYRVQLEQRLQTLERQSRAAYLAFQHVSAALIRKDPADPALMMAEHIISQAFPGDFTVLAAAAGEAIDQNQASGG